MKNSMTETRTCRKRAPVFAGAAPAVLAALALSCGLAMPCLAVGPTDGKPQEEMSHLKDNLLEWYEIDGLVNEYNATVIKNRNEWNKDERRTYDARQVTKYLLDEAEDMEALAADAEDTSALLAANYRNQSDQLRRQAESNVVDRYVLLLQYELTEKQIASGVRKLFLAYYDALHTKEYAEVNTAYLERAYAAVQNRQRLGMATEAEVLTAQENLDQARASRMTAETNIANTARSALVTCGWAYDSDGVIGELPEMTPEEASNVSYETDFEKALAANITLKMDQIKLDNARNGNYSALVVEQNKNQFKDDTDSFGVNFRAAYDTLINTCTAYRNAVQDLELAARNLETAERQLGLGSASQLEYEGIHNAHKAAWLKERTAYTAMLQARAAYDDAVAGNI